MKSWNGLRTYFIIITMVMSTATAIPTNADTLQQADRNYLIIVAEGLNGPALNQFITHKQAMGFQVTRCSVRAGTTKESIKDWIENQYTGSGKWYLLIIGDSEGTNPSGTTLIPHFTGQGWSSAPTDLPYGCMDGDSDWLPDMAIGRFAVDTEAELQTIVNKTILVETGPFIDPAYIKRATFLAGEDYSAGSAETHEWVISQYLAPAGYDITRVYTEQGHDTPEITAAINTGTMWLTYFGHSGFTGWWDPSFNNADVQALANQGLYGVVLSMTCGSAGFNSTYFECLGETFIRESNKGAVSFIGATTLIHASSTDWESSRRLEKYFFGSLIEDGIWEIGPAWQAALRKLYDDPDYGPTHWHVRDYYEMFNILGDPSLHIPHPPIPNGDFDEDGDVDLLDFAAFQACYDVPATGNCIHANLAGGDMIDHSDYVAFETRITGPSS